MLFHVNMAFDERHAFGLQLLPLDSASAKSEAAGAKALCVDHAMAGRDGIAWIFVQRVPYVTAQIAVSHKRGHL